MPATGHSHYRFEPASIPAVCFTDPEIVVAGHTPASAEELGAKQGFKVMQAMFPFAANGRALSLEAPEGFVRVVARADNHLILGWQAVGAAVSELSAAFGSEPGNGRATGGCGAHHPLAPHLG